MIALVKAAVVDVIAVDEVVAEVELAVEADVVSSLASVVVSDAIAPPSVHVDQSERSPG